ncbi:hypothetical protein RND81_14G078900 [Saponaria officinalis]
MFTERPDNACCDFKTKQAGLKASHSVVALVSYTGDELLSQGCGTIHEADEQNNITVITSANLIRRPSKNNIAENSLADDLKVVVHAPDYASYEGNICIYDYHYNLLVITFKSDTPLQAARLGTIDDFSKKVDDSVIAPGRYFTKPFDFMVAPGYFRHDRCDYDCKELSGTTCDITRCGDGGPLINLCGEIIGINFYHLDLLTPFLPINVVKKWWKHYKLHRELRHPYLGFDATNFYVADVNLIERVIRNFPNISQGVIVKTVMPESSAHYAGLEQDDIIVRCDGKTVDSFLQLFEIAWEKVGKTVKLEVARAQHHTLLSFGVTIVEATPDKMNRWVRCDYW